MKSPGPERARGHWGNNNNAAKSCVLLGRLLIAHWVGDLDSSGGGGSVELSLISRRALQLPAAAPRTNNTADSLCERAHSVGARFSIWARFHCRYQHLNWRNSAIINWDAGGERVTSVFLWEKMTSWEFSESDSTQPTWQGQTRGVSLNTPIKCSGSG